jgi:hypothetical protein
MMTTHKQLGTNGRQLSNQLIAMKNHRPQEDNGQHVNVAGVGREVSFAYEQLRNAAEYIQEHLLTQKAIRRFVLRNLSFQSDNLGKKNVAEELLIELIQSGYIENNTQPIEVVDKLEDVLRKHYKNYWVLKGSGVKSSVAQAWTLDLMSVESENLINDSKIQSVYAQFAYSHYLSILHKNSFVTNDSESANFEASLYIAVYRSLFKSDISSIRYDMQRLYDVSDSNINDYASFHSNIDSIYSSELTDKLTQYINKYGAPLRVLKNMVADNHDLGDLLANSERFHAAYAVQIQKEYREASRKLNKGLVKSIIFLLITKALIGVAIEVPYDYAVYGKLIELPLIINLLAPVVYMAILRLGLKTPSVVNTKAMQAYADNMLYGDQTQPNLYPVFKKHSYPMGFKIGFILMFLIIFGVVTQILMSLQFNIVQGAIFFIFFATANFLGFRLSRIVRELELVTSKAGFLSTVRDFIYMPFILLGQWLSEKYNKINIVGLILDTIIELPLKTVLRLIRQWTEFINDKKDDLVS